MLLLLAVREAKAVKKVTQPGKMGRKLPPVSVQTWRDPSLEDAVISAPAPLYSLPFPDRESPHIDPEETFTPQFLPASFYSQGKLQPRLTPPCSPALRRKASQLLTARLQTAPFLMVAEKSGIFLFL